MHGYPILQCLFMCTSSASTICFYTRGHSFGSCWYRDVYKSIYLLILGKKNSKITNKCKQMSKPKILTAFFVVNLLNLCAQITMYYYIFGSCIMSFVWVEVGSKLSWSAYFFMDMETLPVLGIMNAADQLVCMRCCMVWK